jgi:hypothetical protein
MLGQVYGVFPKIELVLTLILKAGGRRAGFLIVIIQPQYLIKVTYLGFMVGKSEEQFYGAFELKMDILCGVVKDLLQEISFA